MRVASVYGCALRVHPLFLTMLFFLGVSGAGSLVLAFSFVLLLHELAHCLCAIHFRIPIAQIEFTPFGGSMQLHQIDALPPGQAFIISCAGPFCNLLLLFISLFVSWRFSLFDPLLLYFIQCNIVMLCVNLIPVLPLDGGRMLLSLMTKRFDRARVLNILLTLGRLLSVALIIAGLFTTQLSLIMLGCYLLYAAAIEERTGTSRYLAAFIVRRIRFEKHKTLPVHFICASSTLPVFMLIPHLRPGAYHIIEILQEDTLAPLGQIKEDALLSAILDQSQLTLGEVLSQ